MKKFLFHVLGAAVVWLSGAERNGIAAASHDDAFSKHGLFKADAATLKDTQLIAHPDLPLVSTNNVLWCGTLQLAWNEAIDLVGEKLAFTTPSPEADLLNRRDFTRAELAPDSYVAVADFERNHVEDKIRAELRKTFHGEASPELIPPTPPNPGPDDFVAYAYLFKNLAFQQPFAADLHLAFAGKPVESFGFNPQSDLPSGTREQVTLCDFQSDHDFIVRLKTRAAGDELILAEVPPAATLEATIQSVTDRLARPAPEDDRIDTLAVPKLNFDLRRDFSELEGLVLVPSPAAKIKNKLVVKKVEQLVRFQLNEKGAVLKSEAVMIMRALAMRPDHRLIFDRPFLILMKQEKAKGPYFALWVGNASLLVGK